MKRTGNLFDAIFTEENLYAAYLDARRGKRKKRSCFAFETNLGTNLKDLYREIHNGTYEPRPYHLFTVYEPKARTIHAPHFRDTVVQHAIYRHVYSIFNGMFISTSFACRRGMGTHRASAYTQSAMRSASDNAYYLKLDIKKFFYSIDRDVLQGLIEQKIKDARLVDIMMMFARCDDATGIPIGNLLSQLFALIYLNPLDHFIKRILHVGRYVRYVDDFILIGHTRTRCHSFREIIDCYLWGLLGLSLSRWTIMKIKRGINFVGYRTFQAYKLIRRYSFCKFKRAVIAGKDEVITSLLGHANTTASLPSMMRFLEEYHG
jgi:RNA-directed DNA polymerase